MDLFPCLSNYSHDISIGITMVCPGFMDTEMPTKNMGVDGSPVGSNDGDINMHMHLCVCMYNI